MTARPPGEVGPIHMAMHFGSVDLSALYGARVGELPVTGPMEFVTSPLARAYFDHVRFELGVTIVPLGDAASSLIAALERGEAVGVVADRNIVGSGAQWSSSGRRRGCPSGRPCSPSRRARPSTCRPSSGPGPASGSVTPCASSPSRGLSRREATRSIIEQEARAFERIVARAPEQWTTLFFPIWSDEEER